MLLSGHAAAVYSVSFDPSGRYLASGSHDKEVFLWSVATCENLGVLKGHKNAVLSVAWNSAGTRVATASADKTIGLWDSQTGKRLKKFDEHTRVCNCVDVSKEGLHLVSGSDDGRALTWDPRSRRPTGSFEAGFAVTSTAFSLDGKLVFTAGIDNEIKAWDRRQGMVSFTMQGHRDTVTGIKVSPDGTKLLSNGMDRVLLEWDIRPFASGDRLVKDYVGVQHNPEKNLLRCSWSSDGEMVSAGSADQVVHIWDVATAEELYHLPGHAGSVNEVAFHPTDSIIASAGSDHNIFLGEL